MNPELQTVVDRLELVERQSRIWKTLALVALGVGVVAIALPYALPSAPLASTPSRARYSVVEANRFLLRDRNGAIAGGMEAQADGSLRLVLGGRSTSSAHLVIPGGGAPQFTFRAADGRVQLGLGGAERPSIWLSPDGQYAQVSLGAGEAKGGEITVRDGVGRPRFHAP